MEWLIDIIKEWLQLYLKGMIVMWSGFLPEIPEGWALCNGDNGTPDLRFRFIQSIYSIENLGETGGEISHTHPFTSNTHKHGVPCEERVDGGGDFYTVISENGPVDTSLDAATGTTDAVAHIPPYYRLAFIMKL